MLVVGMAFFPDVGATPSLTGIPDFGEGGATFTSSGDGLKVLPKGAEGAAALCGATRGAESRIPTAGPGPAR
jgi:hypothetical protein